jgi:uncharacterized protein YodC (DUF2158 family)
MPSFTVGMKVRLNSGGPLMTVQEIDGNSIVCVWFDKTTLRQAKFLADMIETTNLEQLLERLAQERREDTRDPP